MLLLAQVIKYVVLLARFPSRTLSFIILSAADRLGSSNMLNISQIPYIYMMWKTEAHIIPFLLSSPLFA